MLFSVLSTGAMGSLVGTLWRLTSVGQTINDGDEPSWKEWIQPVGLLLLTAACLGGIKWVDYRLDLPPAELRPAGSVISTESHPDGGLFGPSASTTVHTADALYQLDGLPSLPVGTSLVWTHQTYLGEERVKLCVADTDRCAKLLAN